MDNNVNPVTQLMDAFGVTQDEAIFCLEMFDYNLEKAFEEMMLQREHDNGHRAPPTQAPSRQFSNPSNPAPYPQSNADDEDYVRAPIPSTRQVLVDGPDGPPYPAFQAFEDFGPAQFFGNRTGQLSSFQGDGRGNDTHRRLQEMYSPPSSILFSRGYDQATGFAEASKKWLLVMVIDTQLLLSQVPNTVLFKDPQVQALVKKHFIFVQMNCNSADGRKYMEAHPFYDYPHIAVLDPRTNERVQFFSHDMKPVEFIQWVHQFVQEHSLSDFQSATVSEAPTLVNEYGLDHLTEEEQIMLAQQISQSELEEAHQRQQQQQHQQFARPNMIIDDDDADDDEIDLLTPPDSPEIVVEPQRRPPARLLTPIERILAISPEYHEPSGSDLVSVAFRTPAGQRVVKKFSQNASVLDLYACAKTMLSPEEANRVFELKVFAEPTSDKLDLTLTEAKLAGAQLIISFV